LPDVLPDNLHELTPLKIKELIAEHLGADIDKLDSYFASYKMIDAKGGQDIGQVIHNDAVTLHKLGVDRKELSKRLYQYLNVGEIYETVRMFLERQKWRQTDEDANAVATQVPQSTSSSYM